MNFEGKTILLKQTEILKILEALSQDNRLRIFRIMVERSKEGITPGEIIPLLGGIPKNTLSFHLNVLTQANLCTSEKQGKRLIYKPNCAAIQETARFLLRDCCNGGENC